MADRDIRNIQPLGYEPPVPGELRGAASGTAMGDGTLYGFLIWLEAELDLPGFARDAMKNAKGPE